MSRSRRKTIASRPHDFDNCSAKRIFHRSKRSRERTALKKLAFGDIDDCTLPNKTTGSDIRFKGTCQYCRKKQVHVVFNRRIRNYPARSCSEIIQKCEITARIKAIDDDEATEVYLDELQYVMALLRK